MPARITPLINEHFYHIFNRGVNKQPIFENVKDYKRFLTLIRYSNYENCNLRFSKFILLSNRERLEIERKLEKSTKLTDILTYCLMPNHFHLLLRQKVNNGISKFMAKLQNSYGKYLNIKNNRIGPLFQNRFKSVLVETDNQLLHLSRYIHLNPYSSAIIKDFDALLNYQWSSLREYLLISNSEICIKKVILGSFSNPTKYREFILNNSDYQKNLDKIKHLIID